MAPGQPHEETSQLGLDGQPMDLSAPAAPKKRATKPKPKPVQPEMAWGEHEAPKVQAFPVQPPLRHQLVDTCIAQSLEGALVCTLCGSVTICDVEDPDGLPWEWWKKHVVDRRCNVDTVVSMGV